MSNRSSRKTNKQAIHIIGDGCSALSLGARADELPDHQLTIISPSGAPKTQDHIWGFWYIKELDKAAKFSRHSWNRWCIKTSKGKKTLLSDDHAYHALQRTRWENYCRKQAKNHGVIFIEQENLQKNQTAQVLDSRPPSLATKQMFQNFIGWEILAPHNSFDSKTAILMDFRCDQSRGIHFIYLLPFSDCEALVESTMFSLQREPDTFFESAINEYLYQHCEIHEFTTNRIEKGAIPLGRLPHLNDSHIGIGSNGGAIKPSSGYAFAFIQKQISTMINTVKKNKSERKRFDPLIVRSPHKSVDLWMDEIFVTVLKLWPATAPTIFLQMAQVLNGDEFALFLSGEANWLLRLKVILAMPKWVFMKAVFYFLTNKTNSIRKNINPEFSLIKKTDGK